MADNGRYKVAVLWRGDCATRGSATPWNNRFHRIFGLVQKVLSPGNTEYHRSRDRPERTGKDLLKVPIIAAALYLGGARVALPDPCPQAKMIGTLTTPAPHEMTQTMRAAANGKILLMGAGKAITGHAKMTCQGGKFTAEFTSMSDRHRYRCDGEYSGGGFQGTCKLDGGMREIAGRFER